MLPTSRPLNLATFAQLAPTAERHGFAIGAFSPRYPRMIPPILRAAQGEDSPLLVQISQKDMARCRVELEPFAAAFFRHLAELGVTVPVALHLDHTEDVSIIERAVAAGFSSVMIDASDRPLAENIAITRGVVEFGHAHGVSVEGELGTIGAYSFSETDERLEFMYTDPDEVGPFVEGTGVDALAVSVGTAHGVSRGQPTPIEPERLVAIRARTDVHLVLHGGSGVPAEAMIRAIRIPGGGVSKVNLATDLERAMLDALGSEERMVDAQIEALSRAELAKAQDAVERVVRDKIRHTLLSAGGAKRYDPDGSSTGSEGA